MLFNKCYRPQWRRHLTDARRHIKSRLKIEVSAASPDVREMTPAGWRRGVRLGGSVACGDGWHRRNAAAPPSSACRLSQATDVAGAGRYSPLGQAAPSTATLAEVRGHAPCRADARNDRQWPMQYRSKLAALPVGAEARRAWQSRQSREKWHREHVAQLIIIRRVKRARRRIIIIIMKVRGLAECGENAHRALARRRGIGNNRRSRSAMTSVARH